LHAFGGDGKVGRAVDRHLTDLRRRALVHVQRDFRIALHETTDDRRQGVARLGMGSRQGEDALTFMAEFLGDLLDALAFAQYLPRRLDDPLPRRSDPGQMLAAAGEHLYPQLILEQTDLFADP